MKLTLYFLFLIPVIFGCTKINSPLETDPLKSSIRLNQFEKNLVKADNEFGFNLLKTIHQSCNDSNLFISPLSVSMALGMTLNGADGDTYEAMKTVLGYEGFSSEEINSAYQHIITALCGLDPVVSFELANSIWYEHSFPVKPDFIKVNQDYFGAQVNPLNFSDPDAVNIINDWVSLKTHGKIETILNFIPPDIVMYLINAIYFNGTWTSEFDPEYTNDDIFCLSDGSQKSTPFMVQTNHFNYLHNEQIEMIELPYGEGNFSMIVILPSEQHSLDSLISELDSQEFNSLLQSLKCEYGTITLPKFTLEYKITLNDVLQSMGMGIAFFPGYADFSNISEEAGLFISDVLHKSYVKVNEEGTEATAVTSVSIGFGISDDPPLDFWMVANRPFLFIIMEKSTGIILFVGKIVEPEWNN